MRDGPTTLLAFDYGRRRIGVAVGQTITASARPLDTVPARGDDPDWERIGDLIDQWSPDLLLVGLPVWADGAESEQCAAARGFAARLADFELPVQLIDEHLTSSAAADELRSARAAGRRTRRVRKGDIDAVSAVLIAEQWLHERDLGSHGT